MTRRRTDKKKVKVQEYLNYPESSEELPSASSSEDILMDTRIQVVSLTDETKLVVKVKGDVPTQGTTNAACWDIRSSQAIELPPESTTIIDTGLYLEIPEGYGLLLLSRSKLAQEGITVNGGVIDADYRGQIRVLLHNSTRKSKRVQKSERIAQGWFLKSPQVEFVKSDQLSNTTRGEHGFGSTGTM